MPITASILELPSAVAPCISALLAATALSLEVGLLLGAAPGQGAGLLPAGLPAVKLLDCTEDLNLCRKHWLKLPCEACCRRCRAPGKLLTGFLCIPSCRDAGVADVLHALLCVAGCPGCSVGYLWMLQRPTSCAMGIGYVQPAEGISQQEHECFCQRAQPARALTQFAEQPPAALEIKDQQVQHSPGVQVLVCPQQDQTLAC